MSLIMNCPKALQDRNGKPSSKRIMGYYAAGAGVTMGIVSGFEFYSPEIELIITLLGFATTLLVGTVVEKQNTKNEES